MIYLLIFEDGTPKYTTELTEEIVECITNNIMSAYKFQDNNFHEIRFDSDGDMTETPVPLYVRTEEQS